MLERTMTHMSKRTTEPSKESLRRAEKVMLDDFHWKALTPTKQVMEALDE